MKPSAALAELEFHNKKYMVILQSKSLLHLKSNNCYVLDSHVLLDTTAEFVHIVKHGRS